MTIEERIAEVHAHLTETNAVLMEAVERAMYDAHDATSAITVTERVRRLQSEQGNWIAEALGLLHAEAGIEQITP